jgi:hypothetical protein
MTVARLALSGGQYQMSIDVGDTTNTVAMAKTPVTANFVLVFICRWRTINIGMVPMIKSVAMQTTP